MPRSALSLTFLIFFAISPSSGQQDSITSVTPGTEAWGPAPSKLPAGAQLAAILGDRTQPGQLYVFRAKLPDGYSVPPHTHPMDEHVTVLQGTMLLGFGETRDESEMRVLPAGSFVTLPSTVPHYNRMRGETILQFHGIGPYDINYVDPADDPSR